jgi:hypothetical protein
MLQRLVDDKHSNLLGLFVSYEENEAFMNTAPDSNPKP